MNKNKILNKVIDRLMDQREELTSKLSNVNYNEMLYDQKKMTLENALMNIDMSIDRRVMDIEMTPIVTPKNK